MSKANLEKLNSAMQILENCRLEIQKCENALMEILGTGCESISQSEFDGLQQAEYTLSNISQKVRKHRSQLICNMNPKELDLFNETSTDSRKKNEISDIEEIEKVKRKLPNWRKNPKQFNHKILDAYLKLNKENESITLQDLQDYCKSNYAILGDKFFQNYNQMKMKADKNHGKIFEETHDTQDTYVTLWQPVAEFVKREWEQ